MAAGAPPLPPDAQRDALLDAERAAHRDQPRNFKEDALVDKVVEVQPDGTGPTSTESFDPQADREAGSGSPVPEKDSSAGPAGGSGSKGG